ncbi:hypothetical protein CAS74_000046 [Pichia kudriavzevii]|uniref:CENP-T/Histone H4 histone fold domain-containing protein n=1 Tax=Pichia kudriavzevii TaxID=4909 RepID=A0A1Z8JSX5_PICKU|nr:hypothetical protein CAS74_000046 [Pichia kudriavzevii]
MNLQLQYLKKINNINYFTVFSKPIFELLAQRMSLNATPQRKMELEQAPSRPMTPRSPRSPHSPYTSRSPHTPRKSLTPLTKHALQMSTTPTRNRLLLTPTKNKQRQIYDPLTDLQILGKLFHAQTSIKKKQKPNPARETSPTAKVGLEQDQEIVSGNDRTQSTFSSPSKPQTFAPFSSPTPQIPLNSTIPSFVNKDLAPNSVEHSSSMVVDDTLPITQSQSQSQQVQTPDRDVSRRNTTFESYADTSIAVPEAILRDGSGILGMSDSEDDRQEGDVSIGQQVDGDIPALGEYPDFADLTNEEIEDYKANLSIIQASSDESDEDVEAGDLSLVRDYYEHKETQRKRRRSFNTTHTPQKPPLFTIRLVKKMFQTLQLPAPMNLNEDLFNELTNRFIEIELRKSMQMSKENGMNNRIVYTDLLGDDEDDESILLNAMSECDLETVKIIEGVLYSNLALRKKRHENVRVPRLSRGSIDSQSEAKWYQPNDGTTEGISDLGNIDSSVIEMPEQKDEGSNPFDDDKVVDLDKYSSYITLQIQQDASDSSDLEIPLAVEEEEEEDDEETDIEE